MEQMDSGFQTWRRLIFGAFCPIFTRRGSFEEASDTDIEGRTPFPFFKTTTLCVKGRSRAAVFQNG